MPETVRIAVTDLTQSTALPQPDRRDLYAKTLEKMLALCYNSSVNYEEAAYGARANRFAPLP